MSDPGPGRNEDPKEASARGPRQARSRLKMAISLALWAASVVLALFAGAVVLGVGGYRIPFLANETDLTDEMPFADFIGREYRVKGDVSALAWNDYPDKDKILSVSLTPPSARNRFVSYSIPLKQGQKIRIIGAQRRFALVEFSYRYFVSVPGADLPDVPTTMRIGADGVPDPLLYEAIEGSHRRER